MDWRIRSPDVARKLLPATAMISREPLAVRLMRAVLKRWPFGHGKGMLMRVFRLFWRKRDFLMAVEPGVLIPARLDDYLSYWVFVNGYDSEPEVRLCRRLVLAGDTVFDVGANIGLWIMGAALGAGPTGSAHAFEPVSENFGQLLTNLARNGLDYVRCRRVALSDRSGTATIYASSNGNCGMASLAMKAGVDSPRETRLMALDRYCEEERIERIDFLKVDVEGAELQVFRGAKGVLERPDAPIILFEADESLATPFESSSRVVKSLLSRHGYEVFRYTGSRLEPVDPEERHEHEDLFAFKPLHFKRHGWLRSVLPP